MVISWDEYFMGVALLSSKRSKDPNTQVGACIVNENKVIVGTGYNGTPRGWDDKKFPWTVKGEPIDEKYPYVVHAELNAILNANTSSLKNCTIYATFLPCNECAKAIVQSGINRVVYLSDKYSETPSCKAAMRLFKAVNIKCERFNPTIENLTLEFDPAKYSKNYSKCHVALDGE